MSPKAKRRTEAKSAAMLAALKGGDVVRSWLGNLRKESNGIPLILIVGGKALDADGLLLNIAVAVDSAALD